MRPAARVLGAVALISIGLLLGVFAGYIQMPPDDPTIVQHRWPGSCPRGSDVSTVLTISVTAGQQLDIHSALTVRIADAIPYHGPLDLSLGRPNGAESLAGCFVQTDTKVNHMRWSDGVFEMDLEIEWPRYEEQIRNGLVKIVPGLDHTTLWVDPCAPTWPDYSDGPNMLCLSGTDNLVVLNVKAPLDQVMTSPSPFVQGDDGSGIASSWRFRGPPPVIRADLKVPADTMMRSWLTWRGDIVFLSEGRDVNLNLTYLADNWDLALCLAIAAAALVWLREPTSSRGRLVGWTHAAVVEGWRFACVAVAALLLGVEVNKLGALEQVFPPDNYWYYWPVASAVIVVPAWMLMGLAFATARQAAVIIALGLVALTPILYLAFIFDASMFGSTSTVALVMFCVAFIALLIAAGSALWNPIGRAFGKSVGHSKFGLPRLFRNAAFVVTALAFMLAIGHPIGKLCNCGPTGWPRVEDAASDLVWFLGFKFNSVILWIVTLLIMVVLAERLVRRLPDAASRRLAPLSALLLTLCAPWSANMSLIKVVSWPAWILQFGVLLVVFYYMAAKAEEPVGTKTLDTVRVRELHDAMKLVGGDSGEGSTRKRRRPSEQREVVRLLERGPKDGSLENGIEAARIAAVMAVVPVGFMIWTTFSELGEHLRTHYGVLLVTLLALVELARWVFVGLLYGYLHPQLPGSSGTVKALWMTAFWIASCILPLLIAHAVGHDLIGQTIYRSAQLGVFMLVLSVVYDYRTVEAAGGDFKALQEVYVHQRLVDAVPTLLSALLLVITLFQQLHAGSGTEVAQSLLSGLQPLLSLGRS